MTTTEKQIIVWQDEDGCYWYAEGHHDPDAFLDAVSKQEIVDGNILDSEAETDGIRTFAEVGEVTHLWVTFDSDDDERGTCSEADTPGAEPFTRVACP